MNGLHWLMAAAVCVVLEVILPSFFFWLLSLSALVMAALVAWLGLSWQVQALCFAGLSVMSALGWRFYVKRWQRGDDEADLLTHRSRRLVGQRFELQSALAQGRGRLQIGDTLWQIECEQSALDAGAWVVVISDNDGRLQVKAVE